MISFIDNYAAFQSGVLLANAFQEAVASGGEVAHLRTECQALTQVLQTIGYESEATQLTVAAYHRSDLVQKIPVCLESLPATALQLIRGFFFVQGSNAFGFSEEAASRVLTVFPDADNHGTPVESLFMIPSYRIRTGKMKAGGLPEKATVYRVDVGHQGKLGSETLSFSIFDNVLFLRQIEGGRCPWMGLVNGYQAVAARKLSAMELLEAYRLIMEHLGSPLKRGYYPDDVEALLKKFGGASTVHWDADTTITGQALDEGRFVLVFENGGTRVICGKTAEGNIRWLNFWDNYLVDLKPAAFDRKANNFPYLIIDSALIGRMIGHG